MEGLKKKMTIFSLKQSKQLVRRANEKSCYANRYVGDVVNNIGSATKIQGIENIKEKVRKINKDGSTRLNNIMRLADEAIKKIEDE